MDDADTAEPHDSPASEEEPSGFRGREVEVPMRLYKTVTVFATMLAMTGVILGFIVLDTATNSANAPLSEVNLLLALLGLGLIVAGAAIYAFSTRFRTAGMGKSKDDTDEESDNG
ncbi:DUF7315 family membrane protein [Haloarchaeobius baliensis]|uniref:DUF7315 family membrane protein n=1 Tax=Haloarchaeobius baliensis TaxID=1670458 RepID=UPI003F8856F8